MLRSLVGSEMCIRDSVWGAVGTNFIIYVIAHGVHDIGAVTSVITMNAVNLNVVGNVNLVNGLNEITVNIPAGPQRDTQANRGTLLVNIARSHRVEIQTIFTRMVDDNPRTIDSRIFHIPLALLNSTIFQRSWNHETGPSTTAIIWNQNPPNTPNTCLLYTSPSPRDS